MQAPATVAARLPRRDTWMVLILLGIMGAIDVAAALTGVPDKAKAAFVIEPFSLALVWGCYVLSLSFQSRKANADPRSLAKMAAFMGRSLSLMGGLLTIAHLLVVGSSAWFHGVKPETVVRTIMAGMGVVLVIIFNRAAKLTFASPRNGRLTPPKMSRASAWAGVLCGLGMVVLAFTAAPGGQRMIAMFALMLLPVAVNWGGRLVGRGNRKP